MNTHTRSEATAPSRAPRWLRALIPAVLILVWLALAGVGGPYFGKIGEVSSNDQTAYLPESAQSTQVAKRTTEFTGGDAIPAIVVVDSDEPLTEDALAAINAVVGDFAQDGPVVGQVSPAIPSEDGLAAQVFLPLDTSAELATVVEELRTSLEGLPDGLEAYVTGPAGQAADLGAAFEGIDGLLLLVALGAVLVILVIVYRSPLLPFLVLATSLFALCASILTVWWLAKAELVSLNGQVQGILFILVIGAATDYSLLYVSRYREAIATERRWPATWRALRGSLEPILASGGTVIAGLLCLLLSDLASNQALGPVAAVGIGFAMLAALTFLPALLYATGAAAFWPRRPKPPVGDDAGTHRTGVWGAVARWVTRSPRAIWVGCVVLLVAASVGVTGLKASGVPQSELVLGASDARDGLEVLGEHFPDGSGSPAQVLVAEERLADAAATILALDGVDSLAVQSKDSPSGTLPVSPEGVQPLGEGAPAGEPTVVDGDILLSATLSDAADSTAAEDTVRELRAELGADALVGGVSATALDTNVASTRDRNLIIPVALVVILLILMILLRSIVAPVILMGTVVLSYLATMGVSALVFNEILGFPGADPAVPLYGFVFLVALGVDYNIFLMTRVREESQLHGTREGVVRGLSITGSVITSAGIVLAATFAALAVIPILFLAQLAFIVAFGVLLDTFLVRSLLVPAATYDLGRAVWWPSRLSRSAS